MAQRVETTPTLPPPSELIQPRAPMFPDLAPSIPETEALPPPLETFPVPLENRPNQAMSSIRLREPLFEGNTAFTEAELIAVLQETLSADTLTLADIYWAAEQVANHYETAGYPTTGAIPKFETDAASQEVVYFQVVEGWVEDIMVSGTQRLNPNYVRSRLALAMQPPLKTERLVDSLQLLHNDPLIQSVQARLSAGTELGSNILTVEVLEAETLGIRTFIDNARSAAVGSLQQGISVSEGNLMGQGDRLTLGYNRTEGSNEYSAQYTLPINPRQGTLAFSYRHSNSEIITEEFAVLGINSQSDEFDLTWRQPIIRTPRTEFALGLIGSVSQNQTVFGEKIFGFPIGFPVPGANDDGESQVTAVRFFQDWTARSEIDAFAARSEFSLGLGGFGGGTVNEIAPDNRFLTWRGQTQYRRLLADDMFLLLRSDLQVASRPLLTPEQFSLGGRSTVRGYRQDLLLADNGAFASAEVWVPIIRAPNIEGVLQLTPFLDVGTVWNADNEALNPSALAAVGLGLQWQQEYFSARLDWGIPLIEAPGQGDSWQENGLYFSLSLSSF